jgi:hypothetical protein
VSPEMRNGSRRRPFASPPTTFKLQTFPLQ